MIAQTITDNKDFTGINIYDYDEIMLVLYSNTSYDQLYATEIIPVISDIIKPYSFLTNPYGECGVINITNSSFRLHVSSGKGMKLLGRKFT